MEGAYTGDFYVSDPKTIKHLEIYLLFFRNSEVGDTRLKIQLDAN